MSTNPVAVTQFNPFQGQPLAHSNDASRLRPTASLGTHYRAAGYPLRAGEGTNDSYLAVVAAADGTQVTVTLPSRGAIRAGSGVVAVPPAGAATFTLNLGDVVELVASDRIASDFNGTTIDATHPVQIFTGHPCAMNPAPAVWCDHLEESLAPVDRLGSHYVVPVPSHPLAGQAPVGHSVIFVGAPSHLDAGEVYDVGRVTFDFDVRATRPFVLLTMMLGSAQLDTSTYHGDPSFGIPHDTSELRPRYLFFTPPGYDRTVADVVAPLGAALVVDGVPSVIVPIPIGGGFAVHRVELAGGAPHEITSAVPVGVQVMGFANAESYYYPATGTP